MISKRIPSCMQTISHTRGKIIARHRSVEWRMQCSTFVKWSACYAWTMLSTPSWRPSSSSVVRVYSLSVVVIDSDHIPSSCCSKHTERPALREPQKIEHIQSIYLETLRAYVENHRPPDKCYFAKLLSILTELRSLGNVNSEVCFSLKVQNKRLPPFLAEIWDIQE
jgi:hypothetical protein